MNETWVDAPDARLVRGDSGQRLWDRQRQAGYQQQPSRPPPKPAGKRGVERDSSKRQEHSQGRSQGTRRTNTDRGISSEQIRGHTKPTPADLKVMQRRAEQSAEYQKLMQEASEQLANDPKLQEQLAMYEEYAKKQEAAPGRAAQECPSATTGDEDDEEGEDISGRSVRSAHEAMVDHVFAGLQKVHGGKDEHPMVASE